MKHKLIKTDNYLLVVDDSEIKDVRPYEGKWQLEKGYILNKFPDYLTDLSECKIVIAHLPLNNSPILEGVPLLPPLEQEDDVEMEYYTELEQRREIVKNFKGQVAGRHPDMFGGNEMHHMVRGYMEAKQKYKYTEEDMIQAFAYGRTLEPFDSFEDFIQSLSQPKMPTHFKATGVIETYEGDYAPVMLGKYIYEGGDQ